MGHPLVAVDAGPGAVALPEAALALGDSAVAEDGRLCWISRRRGVIR